jgi:uncharacterized protein
MLIHRFLRPPQESFFLFGPRGVGKSTWLKKIFPNALWIDLLDSATYRLYSSKPEHLEAIVRGAQQLQIVIDEIQKVPELLSVVHKLIREKQDWQFILTGSSSRKLKRTGVDLLAGRAIIRHLHPFMAAELKNNFDLNKTLEDGLLPHVYSSTTPKDVLRAYIGLYLKEEVQTEGLVRNIGHFARFIEIASFSHGCILNISNIAQECGVSRKLVENYLSILEDLLLAFQLPVFTRRAKRQIIAHPKFYYFDVGVYKQLRATGPLDKPSEIDGPGLEGLVAQHLRAWNDYQGSNHTLYYWRTRHGVEVDFIVYGTNGFWAIEVKNGQQVHSQDLRGLEAFCSDYPEATPLLLYRGKDRLKIRNILCLPIEEFLKNLTPEKEVLY